VYKLPQKLLAEFIGTFALIFFGAGSICANQVLHTAGQRDIGLLGIALATGLAYGVMVTALGHVSGGHFNPAVTIGYWVTRKVSTFDTLAYWVAQLLGAVSAAFCLRLLPVDVWSAVQMGTPALASGITRTTGMLLEGLMTFFLVLVFFATTSGERASVPRSAGLAIGLTVIVGTLLGGPFTGAALNPARAFGPALAANQWANHGVYWVGPLAGGVAAAWLHDFLFLKRESS
jgi:MIP family channel proteins